MVIQYFCHFLQIMYLMREEKIIMVVCTYKRTKNADSIFHNFKSMYYKEGLGKNMYVLLRTP